VALPFPRERLNRPRGQLSERRVSWRRLLAAGLLAAAVTAVTGFVLERIWLGPNDASADARVRMLVDRNFGSMTTVLAGVAGRIATEPAARDPAAGGEAARALFDLLAATRAASPRPDDIAITVYDAVRGEARAWSGRPSDILPERIVGPQDLFVTRTALGLRLVHLQPIVGTDGEAAGRRVGAVAVEHVLSRAAAGAAIQPVDDTLATSIVPVHVRVRSEGAGALTRPGAFVLTTASGAPLVEAFVARADLQQARASWRRTVTGWVVAVLGVTALLLIGPLLDARSRARQSRTVVLLTAGASLLLLAGAGSIWSGIAFSTAGQSGLPLTLSFCATAAAALAALWASPATLLHLVLRPGLPPGEAWPRFVLVNAAAGLAVAALILAFARVLAMAVDPATVDVRHFSLYPWNGARVLRLAGILALHVAALWTATLVLIVARAAWRLASPGPGVRLVILAFWILPTLAVSLAALRSGWQLPIAGLFLSAFACGMAALLARRVVGWYRHATIAARIFGLFVAFLVPAVLLYPSLNFFAGLAIERLITTYAVEAKNHSAALLDRLGEAQREIDALAGLSDLVAEPSDCQVTDPKNAFFVWSQTVLGRARLTSAVELYARNGCQVSRFALNLPEYTGTSQQPVAGPTCQWDVFGEPLPIGSQKRLVLHAERGICPGGAGPPVGSIVLHLAVDDYRTLPFITSQSPYFELFRPSQGAAAREAAPGNDVHVAIYGWGLEAVYTSALSAWPITETLFQRIYDPERRPFWESIPLGEDTYRVYFSNDRAGIYAIGYPQLTLFDHFVHLAEVSTLAAAAFVLVLFATAVFTRLSRERPRVGRALLREIRASFYRKLFLAFVLASIVPVLVLALVIRAYFADLLRKDIQAEAVRTAAVAQRVIEESDALLNRGADRVEPPRDDVMVWISQVIDQDVNIFDGPGLVATSERDLFASGLLPTRTSDDVYRAIVLERRPSFVDEDQLGATPYLVAATPLRVAGGGQLILTVPAALRQRDIEREIDDLDRGVHLAVLVFVLLGAALGLSLAERIADPVRRLTRVTQRIARGDFDARIAVRSVDELRRLVDAFNSMAAELKAQRGELERTHRLEAWAEMARQVAHEIKNPLTPIQLSAEHLARVHEDKGQPLGPVLDGCVNAILGQVRLLRQIASEFSSFASSPVVKLASVDVPELVAEILAPYRAGLSGRIVIVNNLTSPLPPVHVDRTLVLRALANIVENALHAMPGTGTLTVAGGAEDGRVVVAVHDDGVGMDEDALARVFEPYFSTKTSGTGLGLPIARRNVELSGGTIDVQSRKGAGTTVTVRLPVAAEPSASAAANTPSR
jgi:signal transduction histidine kinase